MMSLQQQKNKSLKQELEQFIIDWNNKYPIDYWWRKKYNIPFGSKQHKDMSFFDMQIDFMEERMMRELIKNTETKKDKDKSEEEDSIMEIENKTNVVKMTDDEIDEEFKKL